MISRSARLYRNVSEGGFLQGTGRILRQGPRKPAVRDAALAYLCRQHALETHGPATVLSNHQHECLYLLGPTERYLRMAPGHATLDVLTMVHAGLRTKLQLAVQQAIQENACVVVSGGRTVHEGRLLPFRIEVHPVRSGDEDLLLMYFVDETGHSAPRLTELEKDQGTVRSVEMSGHGQRATRKAASSLNEEFLTSKEELQSLNEELTALNSQLQEALEQQRTTSNDLQNVLYSTDVATLFLDAQLNIRFFTPATKSLFSVLPSDVGRPLTDLHSLAADSAFPADSRAVLQTLTPVEREVETLNGIWCRRILPYRTHDNRVEGVVITFTDITERKHAAQALEAAKQQAELSNIAKSRFLAAASHDLRQPLQTLALLQGLLARRVEDEGTQKLVARLDDTLGAMSGLLNTLLDINQIEAGVIRAELADFKINDLLNRLKDEFIYHAEAQGLAFRVVPCGLKVHSDPHLLEQMVRNLVSNALKYTKQGKVLLGCRRHGGTLSIEVWDTGVGIPEGELTAIFGEYHQLDNAEHERNRGLGLGLSIVQRLGGLLGHGVRVRSRHGLGAVFAIDVALTAPNTTLPRRLRPGTENGTVKAAHRTGLVLVVEDDPDVRDLLTLLLTEDGHQVAAVSDGLAALDLVTQQKTRPDLVLADYNLPNGMDGLAVTAKLREALQRDVPVVILTGDISTDALRAIAGRDCRQLNKPVKVVELTKVIQDLLPPEAVMHSHTKLPHGTDPHVIFVVDDDSHIRASVRAVLEDDGHTVEDHASSEAFLDTYQPGRGGCLLIDAYLPGIGGIELLQRLRAAGDQLPAIMITGNSDVPMAVEAMKAGASDFIEKPIGAPDLLASIERALEQSRDSSSLLAWRDSAATHIASLTPRQRQIMDLVLAGYPSKNIAADLGVSQRTVENHRASIMRKSGAKSLPALARLALAATGKGSGPAN